MSHFDLETTYLEGPSGPLFCLTFLPHERQKRFSKLIIHVPPFAEEMNKSRPMVSVQATQMASMGIPVILFDMFGTGDSGGQLEEANWDCWIRDLRFICNWALQNFNPDELVLWGLRAGCLLAGDFVQRDVNQVSGLLFWQPIVSGEQVLTQLRRLDQLSHTGKRSHSLQMAIEGNETYVEIAGYILNADLIREISLANFRNWRIPSDVKIDWLEVSALDSQKLSHASEQLLNATRQTPSYSILSRVVKGEPFWLTPEVSMVPALLEETMEILSNSNREKPSVRN